MKICVLGHTGFLGKTVFEKLSAQKKYTVVGVNSETNVGDISDAFDVVVNCAGNAQKHSIEDDLFACASAIDTEISVLDSLWFLAKTTNRIIHISSIDATEGSMYGKIKSQVEQKVRGLYKEFLILRPAGLIGPGLKKNVVYDICNHQQIYVAKHSIFNFISTEEVANIIEYTIDHPEKRGTINVAASKSILVSGIIKLLGNPSVTSLNNRFQNYDIDIPRLQSFFDVKDSKFYLKKYFTG